ncbi:hypothetical protein DCCM_2746 [Desulfocucumis palustris]|uniref:Uncharacterized protein n=1 Tax=Desulfocucumis palustris TaxID=1898651 RepID=A0A2L2XBY0_9FIRM|nr:hypothetical protein [Desulfocucumis palustris]GBF33640.1 hypothetical protein DCCM_2746 [Desulfocucumis palustris]
MFEKKCCAETFVSAQHPFSTNGKPLYGYIIMPPVQQGVKQLENCEKQ